MSRTAHRLSTKYLRSTIRDIQAIAKTTFSNFQSWQIILHFIFYRLLSKFLSLFFTDAGENRIYFCEQVYASRDNMSGSSSCERNRAFYEVSVSENEARYYICKGTARNFRVGRVKAPFESLFLPLPPYRPLYHDPVFLRIRDTKGRERRRWKIKGGRKKREGGKKKMRGKSASR